MNFHIRTHALVAGQVAETEIDCVISHGAVVVVGFAVLCLFCSIDSGKGKVVKEVEGMLRVVVLLAFCVVATGARSVVCCCLGTLFFSRKMMDGKPCFCQSIVDDDHRRASCFCCVVLWLSHNPFVRLTTVPSCFPTQQCELIEPTSPHATPQADRAAGPGDQTHRQLRQPEAGIG